MSNTYWDESEFGFFETLEDEDKLLYLYDLMIGEFAYSEIHNEGVREDEEEDSLNSLMNDAIRGMGDEDEIDDDETDLWDFETESNKVYVSFITDGDLEKLQLKGPEIELLLKVVNDMMMNGMILTDRTTDFDKYEPWGVKLTYTLVGTGPPFSVN